MEDARLDLSLTVRFISCLQRFDAEEKAIAEHVSCLNENFQNPKGIRMLLNDKHKFSGLPESTEVVKVSFSTSPDPFENKGADSRRKWAQKVGEKAKKKFERSARRLVKLIGESNPIQVLAHLQFYDCTILDRRTLEGYEPVQQYGIELFQALYLTFRSESLPVKDTPPKVILEINRCLNVIGQTAMLREMAEAVPRSLEQSQYEVIRQVQKMHTFAVRNAGYLNQVLKQLKVVFGAMDDDYELLTGVRLSLLVAMWENLVKVSGSRIAAQRNRLIEISKAVNPEDAIRMHCQLFEEPAATENHMLAVASVNSLSLEETLRYYNIQADRRNILFYLFSEDDLLEAYPGYVDRDKFANVTSKWMRVPGSLEGRELEHMLLDNPIWNAPIIQCAEGIYYWPILQIFHSFGLEMMERLVFEHPQLKERYQSRVRPKYLESEVAELFSKGLPSSRVYTNVCWTDPETNKMFETDVVVVVDSVVILIECKAGRISPSSRRGAPMRLKKELKKLIEEAAQQSKRLMQQLESNVDVPMNSAQGAVAIDNSYVSEIIRLNITLDYIGPVACELRALNDAGLVDQTLNGAPTIAVVDLETVMHMLDRECERVRYFVKRSEIESRMKLLCDELDLLALYMANGMNMPFHELEHYQSNLSGMSTQLEPYLLARCLGKEVVKPRCQNIPLWTKILDRWQEMQPNGWMAMSIVLLSLSYSDQVEFDAARTELCSKIAGSPRDPNEDYAIVCKSGPPHRKTVVVLVVVRSVLKEDRDSLIRGVLAPVLAQESNVDVLWLCVNAFRPEIPFVSAGLYSSRIQSATSPKSNS